MKAVGVFQPLRDGIGLNSQGSERENEVASCSRIWPITKPRSEDRVNDPRLPVRSGPSYCRDARRRAAILLVLALTLTRKFFELSGHADASLSDHVCAPSNGILAAVYDSIGPAIVAHDRQQRYPLAPRT